jgi:hypothetical protein
MTAGVPERYRVVARRIAVGLGSAVVSVGLSLIATLFVLAASGSVASQAATVMVYLAFWPSAAVGFMNDNICSPRQLIANSTGWAVFVVLVVSLVDLYFRDRSQRLSSSQGDTERNN